MCIWKGLWMLKVLRGTIKAYNNCYYKPFQRVFFQLQIFYSFVCSPSALLIMVNYVFERH